MITMEKVDHIQKRCDQHNLQELIEDFVNNGYKTVEIHYNDQDYKNVDSCWACLHYAIKRSGYNIKVHRYRQHIYLERVS